MELGDHSTVRCEKTDLVADIEFKTKGFIGGKYDIIHGSIKRESSGEKLYEIDGKWNEKMTIKNLKTKKTETFFDATNARETPITTKSVDQMAERESRKLWRETTDAIKARDQTTATNAKSFIEDGQRDEAKVRHEKGQVWQPKFFEEIGPEDYRFKVPKDITGNALKDRMEEMAGGITAQRTPTKISPSTVTASAPAAQPAKTAQVGQTATTPNYTTSSSIPPQHHQSSSAELRQQPYNLAPPQPRQANHTPAAPTPGSVPSAGIHQERPALHPVDSENQPFVDAQEDFDKLSINH